MKKRIFCFLLALCMLLGILPVISLAAETEEETPHSHTIALINTKEATETEPGYTGDLACSGCGEVFISGFEIPATGSDEEETTPGETEHSHTPELINAKEATETEPGYTGDIVCSKCNKVLLEGTEIAATGSESIEQPNPFVDINSLDYFYDSVLWAYYNGITDGYGFDNVFAPDEECTRGQIVTFLWRAAGEPQPASRYNPFTDIQPSDYFYTAVLWAVEQGITEGYGSHKIFNPNGVCTRGQAVTFLWRAKGEPAAYGISPFLDVWPNAYYYSAVLWAHEEEITTGTTAMTFSPNDSCTRAQIVTFLYRALN